MATPNVAEMTDLILDRLQANTAVDPAFTTAEVLRELNAAYLDTWELSGGALTRVTGMAMWTPQPSVAVTGRFTSLAAGVGEIKEIFHSTIFESTGDATAGDIPLSPVDLSEVLYMRQVQTMFGKYLTPKIYAVTPNFSTDPAQVNKVQLDVWPGLGSGYLPTHYIPELVKLDGSSVTVPAVNDIAANYLWLLAASRMAPRTGRSELVPGILADLERVTERMLARKGSSLLAGKADR